MSAAYVPRHAPARPRLTPRLLAALDVVPLAVAVLALVLTLAQHPGTIVLTSPRAPASAPAAQTVTPSPKTALRPRTAPAAPLPYVVQPGDSLWSVAAWYYGDGASWPRIWAANRAAVGPDPDLIVAGERLTFPPLRP